MWEDVLIIITLAIAVLTWFGVRPQQVAGAARQWATKTRLTKLAVVSVAAVMTLSFISVFIVRYDLLGEDVDKLAILIMWVVIIWFVAILSFFSPPLALRKALFVILLASVGPVIALYFVYGDAPLWRKLVETVGGLAGGFAAGWLAALIERYLTKRLASRKRTDKSA